MIRALEYICGAIAILFLAPAVLFGCAADSLNTRRMKAAGRRPKEVA